MKRWILSDNELFEIKVQEYERGLKDAQPAVDEGFVNIWADKYLSKGDVCYLRKQVKLMLKEAGVEVKDG